MQFQRNDKKRSAQPASEGRPAKDLQPTKKHPQRHCPWLLLANPAHAGKRARWGQGDTGTRDHPRMYGEKGSSAAVRRRARGSPPRMRGKAVSNSRLKHPDRITPAYTGKRKRRERPRWVASDHPRMCGEKISFFFTGCSPRGSPPHVRGKVVRCIRSAVPTGITPACAGKRGQGLQENGLGWDHPRMCGEKDLLFWPLSGLKGSPPHVRGKGTGILQNLQRVGITPACAGKRGRRRKGAVNGRDHPRMCGEKPPLKGYCT